MRSVLLAVLSLLVAHSSPRPAADHVDPPLRLTLQIDGQDFALVDGQEATLTIDGKQRTVRATVAPTRRFDAAGLRFDFPRDMSVEFEDSGSVQTWTLDGSDVVVSIHRQPSTNLPIAAEVLTQQAKSLGVATGAPAACIVNLGGTEHAAFETRIAVASAHLHLRALDLEVGDGMLMLLVQDSCSDDGKDSAECERMLDLLAKTFAVTAAK